MPHFFIKSADISDKNIIITDKELLKHLSLSLRIRCNEQLKLIDENEIQYETVVKSVSQKEIIASIVNSYPSKRKLPYSLCLVQSVLKPDAQSLLISNATQCGVNIVYPVMSDNCAVSKKNVADRVSRWQKIADESSKQCERANFAKIENVCELKDFMESTDSKNVLVFAEKYATYGIDEALKEIDCNKDIYVLIGPEGGYSEDEFLFFKKKGYKLVSLGDLIYKAPNAVVAGISNINTRLL